MRWLILAGLVLATLAGLALILLAVPVELWLRAERTDETRVELGIGWLAGRLPQSLVVVPGQPSDEPEPPEPTETEQRAEAEAEPVEEAGPSAVDRARQGLALVRSEGFLSHTGRTLKRVVTSFQVRSLSIEGTLGTGDPADTGILYGRVQAAMPATYAVQRLDVDVQPDFDREVLEGAGELRLRARPLRVAWVLLSYVLSPTTLRALLAARRAGRRA